MKILKTKLESENKITDEEKLELKEINLQINKIYLDLAKGALIRSRVKWLREGKKHKLLKKFAITFQL